MNRPKCQTFALLLGSPQLIPENIKRYLVELLASNGTLYCSNMPAKGRKEDI